jgi:hypothetical protein
MMAVALSAALSACAADAPSLIPIDVSAPEPLAQVTVEVLQGEQVVQAGSFDWARAVDDVLRVAILLEPRISGEVLVKVGGTTRDRRPTEERSHRVTVTPGQVAPTVRIVLLPP